MPTMRVALYGLGRMGSHHRRHLEALGAEVTVVDPPRAMEPGLAGIEAVVVASPTRTHVEVARPWLDRGVPVLVEKPLAASVAEAAALRHPGLAVGHVERFNPAFAAVSSVPARFVQAERLAPWADRGIDVDVVLDLMVHDLDLFLALGPPSPVAEVRANGLSVVSDRTDIVHARVALADGRVGVFTASRISRKPARNLRLFAPAGYWSVDLASKAVVHVDGRLREAQVPVEPRDALGEELRAFLAFARGEARFPVGAVEALAALDVAERVRAACAS
jgi:predicted dehydrogenase